VGSSHPGGRRSRRLPVRPEGARARRAVRAGGRRVRRRGRRSRGEGGVPVKRVDRARPEPLYHQLEVLLRGRILSGEWPPGTRIPTGKELCDTYKVSRVTARQAMRNLVDGGFVTRKPGRGTYVRAPLLTAGERGLRSFSEDMRDLSLRPGSKLLSLDVEPADVTELERLDLAVGSQVVRIKRLRTGDGHPIGVQLTRLPASRFGDLSADELA